MRPTSAYAFRWRHRRPSVGTGVDAPGGSRPGLCRPYAPSVHSAKQNCASRFKKIISPLTSACSQLRSPDVGCGEDCPMFSRNTNPEAPRTGRRAACPQNLPPVQGPRRHVTAHAPTVTLTATCATRVIAWGVYGGPGGLWVSRTQETGPGPPHGGIAGTRPRVLTEVRTGVPTASPTPRGTMALLCTTHCPQTRGRPPGTTVLLFSLAFAPCPVFLGEHLLNKSGYHACLGPHLC